MFSIVNSKQNALFGIDVAFTIIPTLALAVRFYCRLKVKGRLTASDYCLLGALLCSWAVTACGMVIVLVGGVGLHQSDLSQDTVTTYLKILFAIELLWAGAEGLLKTSMCLFFIEIFHPRNFRIMSYVVIGICNAFALTVILSTTFICDPVELSWLPSLPGRCLNRNALWLAIGLLNIVTDILVLALPLPQVWTLQITRRQKIAVSTIFGLGFFVCVISAIRLKFLLSVDFYGDTSYTVADAVLWSTLEPTTGVLVACLPAFGYLFRKWTDKTSAIESDPYHRISKRFDTYNSRRNTINSKRNTYNSKRNTLNVNNVRKEKTLVERSSHESTIAYPLVSVAVTSNTGDKMSETAASSITRYDSSSDEAGLGQISVKREWEVTRSDS